MTEVNLSDLTIEALTKSTVLWLRVRGRDRATWFATGEAGSRMAGQVLLASGGPEPDLGALPEQVEVILRSKGDGGRLLTLHTHAQAIEADNPLWEPVAAALVGQRLNAPPGLVERWRRESTLWVLAPFGAPVQAPGRAGPKGDERASDRVSPGTGARRTRRPWHLGGRPLRRRGTP